MLLCGQRLHRLKHDRRMRNVRHVARRGSLPPADKVVAMVTAGRRDRRAFAIAPAPGLRGRVPALGVRRPRRRGYRVVHAGLRVRIRRSKTDQEGVGTTIAVVAGYAR
jgi:hypothetical protein